MEFNGVDGTVELRVEILDFLPEFNSETDVARMVFIRSKNAYFFGMSWGWVGYGIGFTGTTGGTGHTGPTGKTGYQGRVGGYGTKGCTGGGSFPKDLIKLDVDAITDIYAYKLRDEFDAHFPMCFDGEQMIISSSPTSIINNSGGVGNTGFYTSDYGYAYKKVVVDQILSGKIDIENKTGTTNVTIQLFDEYDRLIPILPSYIKRLDLERIIIDFKDVYKTSFGYWGRYLKLYVTPIHHNLKYLYCTDDYDYVYKSFQTSDHWIIHHDLGCENTELVAVLDISGRAIAKYVTSTYEIDCGTFEIKFSKKVSGFAVLKCKEFTPKCNECETRCDSLFPNWFGWDPEYLKFYQKQGATGFSGTTGNTDTTSDTTSTTDTTSLPPELEPFSEKLGKWYKPIVKPINFYKKIECWGDGTDDFDGCDWIRKKGTFNGYEWVLHHGYGTKPWIADPNDITIEVFDMKGNPIDKFPWYNRRPFNKYYYELLPKNYIDPTTDTIIRPDGDWKVPTDKEDATVEDMTLEIDGYCHNSKLTINGFIPYYKEYSYDIEQTIPRSQWLAILPHSQCQNLSFEVYDEHDVPIFEECDECLICEPMLENSMAISLIVSVDKTKDIKREAFNSFIKKLLKGFCKRCVTVTNLKNNELINIELTILQNGTVTKQLEFCDYTKPPLFKKRLRLQPWKANSLVNSLYMATVDAKKSYKSDNPIKTALDSLAERPEILKYCAVIDIDSTTDLESNAPAIKESLLKNNIQLHYLNLSPLDKYPIKSLYKKEEITSLATTLPDINFYPDKYLFYFYCKSLASYKTIDPIKSGVLNFFFNLNRNILHYFQVYKLITNNNINQVSVEIHECVNGQLQRNETATGKITLKAICPYQAYVEPDPENPNILIPATPNDIGQNHFLKYNDYKNNFGCGGGTGYYPGWVRDKIQPFGICPLGSAPDYTSYTIDLDYTSYLDTTGIYFIYAEKDIYETCIPYEPLDFSFTKCNPTLATLEPLTGCLRIDPSKSSCSTVRDTRAYWDANSPMGWDYETLDDNTVKISFFKYKDSIPKPYYVEGHARISYNGAVKYIYRYDLNNYTVYEDPFTCPDYDIFRIDIPTDSDTTTFIPPKPTGGTGSTGYTGWTGGKRPNCGRCLLTWDRAYLKWSEQYGPLSLSYKDSSSSVISCPKQPGYLDLKSFTWIGDQSCISTNRSDLSLERFVYLHPENRDVWIINHNRNRYDVAVDNVYIISKNAKNVAVIEKCPTSRYQIFRDNNPDRFYIIFNNPDKQLLGLSTDSEPTNPNGYVLLSIPKPEEDFIREDLDPSLDLELKYSFETDSTSLSVVTQGSQYILNPGISSYIFEPKKCGNNKLSHTYFIKHNLNILDSSKLGVFSYDPDTGLRNGPDEIKIIDNNTIKVSYYYYSKPNNIDHNLDSYYFPNVISNDILQSSDSPSGGFYSPSSPLGYRVDGEPVGFEPYLGYRGPLFDDYYTLRNRYDKPGWQVETTSLINYARDFIWHPPKQITQEDLILVPGDPLDNTCDYYTVKPGILEYYYNRAGYWEYIGPENLDSVPSFKHPCDSNTFTYKKPSPGCRRCGTCYDWKNINYPKLKDTLGNIYFTYNNGKPRRLINDYTSWTHPPYWEETGDSTSLINFISLDNTSFIPVCVDSYDELTDYDTTTLIKDYIRLYSDPKNSPGEGIANFCEFSFGSCNGHLFPKAVNEYERSGRFYLFMSGSEKTIIEFKDGVVPPLRPKCFMFLLDESEKMMDPKIDDPEVDPDARLILSQKLSTFFKQKEDEDDEDLHIRSEDHAGSFKTNNHFSAISYDHDYNLRAIASVSGGGVGIFKDYNDRINKALDALINRKPRNEQCQSPDANLLSRPYLYIVTTGDKFDYAAVKKKALDHDITISFIVVDLKETGTLPTTKEGQKILAAYKDIAKVTSGRYSYTTSYLGVGVISNYFLKEYTYVEQHINVAFDYDAYNPKYNFFNPDYIRRDNFRFLEDFHRLEIDLSKYFSDTIDITDATFKLDILENNISLKTINFTKSNKTTISLFNLSTTLFNNFTNRDKNLVIRINYYGIKETQHLPSVCDLCCYNPHNVNNDTTSFLTHLLYKDFIERYNDSKLDFRVTGEGTESKYLNPFSYYDHYTGELRINERYLYQCNYHLHNRPVKPLIYIVHYSIPDILNVNNSVVFFQRREDVYIWTITHNLGIKYPEILVFDQTDQQIPYDKFVITYFDEYIQIDFSQHPKTFKLIETTGQTGDTGTTGSTGTTGTIGWAILRKPGELFPDNFEWAPVGGTGGVGGPPNYKLASWFTGGMGGTGWPGCFGLSGGTGGHGQRGPLGDPGPTGATGPIGGTGACDPSKTGATGGTGGAGPTGGTGYIRPELINILTGGTGGLGNGASGGTGETGRSGGTGGFGSVLTGNTGRRGPEGASGASGGTGYTGNTGGTGGIGAQNDALESQILGVLTVGSNQKGSYPKFFQIKLYTNYEKHVFDPYITDDYGTKSKNYQMWIEPYFLQYYFEQIGLPGEIITNIDESEGTVVYRGDTDYKLELLNEADVYNPVTYSLPLNTWVENKFYLDSTSLTLNLPNETIAYFLETQRVVDSFDIPLSSTPDKYNLIQPSYSILDNKLKILFTGLDTDDIYSLDLTDNRFLPWVFNARDDYNIDYYTNYKYGYEIHKVHVRVIMGTLKYRRMMYTAKFINFLYKF